MMASAAGGVRRQAAGTKLMDRAGLAVRFPLHYAVLNGQVERVRFLLGVPAAAGAGARRGPGLRPDDEDDLGRTALHVAAAFGHVEICQLILGLDKSLVHARANGVQGVYPLHVACAGGWERDTFLSDEDFYARLGGADGAPAPAPGRTARGGAPAGSDAEGDGEGTDRQQRRLAVVRLLLESGGDATCRTEAGTSPLHLAAGCGDLEIARKLIEYGADMNCRNKSGRTPLFSAVSNGQRELVAYLLNMDADATVVTSTGVGVLHAAAMCSQTHPDVIDWLVSAGATLHGRKSDGKTPLALATQTLLDVSVANMTSEEPFWHEDEEYWPEIDRNAPKFSAAGVDKWTFRRVASITAGVDVEALKAKFGITEDDMLLAKAQLAPSKAQVGGCVCVCVCVRVCVAVCVCVCVYTQTRARARTHTHKHTHHYFIVIYHYFIIYFIKKRMPTPTGLPMRTCVLSFACSCMQKKNLFPL